jgi:hypothetical protein
VGPRKKRKISADRVITSALVLLLLAGTSLRIASAGQSDSPSRGVDRLREGFRVVRGAGRGNRSSSEPGLLGQTRARFAAAVAPRSRLLRGDTGRDVAEAGVLVFAEPGAAGERNPVGRRVRRAGSKEPDPSGAAGQRFTWTKLTLYMGAFDQRSVSQPLDVEAPSGARSKVRAGDFAELGFSSGEKNEIDKDLTEEDVRRICGQIAADLTALQGNPAVLARANEPQTLDTHSTGGYQGTAVDEGRREP